jgi:PTS system nitrogen regulatory IIA component
MIRKDIELFIFSPLHNGGRRRFHPCLNVPPGIAFEPIRKITLRFTALALGNRRYSDYIIFFGIDNLKNQGNTSCMTLVELLEPELVLTKTVCASKDELIDKLVDRVYSIKKDFPFLQKDLLNSINMREQIGGTMLPSGLSVPHARIREYDGFILTLGIPLEPIFHDGIQIRLMSLMISSQSGGPYYLPALAALTKISRDNDFFNLLCGANDTEDFIDLLRKRDGELA